MREKGAQALLARGHGVIVIVAVAATVSFRGEDKPQYFTTKADRGDIHEVVEATGSINAVITVASWLPGSGTISHLFVDFNSRVKKGASRGPD